MERDALLGQEAGPKTNAIGAIYWKDPHGVPSDFIIHRVERGRGAYRMEDLLFLNKIQLHNQAVYRFIQ